MLEECNCELAQTIFYDIVLAIATGIIASLLTTILLKHFEKQKAKSILLTNFRFMEAIEESHMFARYFLISAKPILKYYGGIEWFHFPGKVDHERKKNFWEDKKSQKDILKFLNKNKHDIETFVNIIVSDKNDVIYETINKSLGISFNQALCNISDNLKNRSHNFTDSNTKLDLNKIIENKNIFLAYYTLFHILAYISYLFDLYSFLGVESRLDRSFDFGLEKLRKQKPLT